MYLMFISIFISISKFIYLSISVCPLYVFLTNISYEYIQIRNSTLTDSLIGLLID